MRTFVKSTPILFALIVDIIVSVASSTAATAPNIVFVLTDNQDVTMGGMTPMRNTRKLVAEQGATFSNAFASTPVCCPSRATILSGLYPHNHKTVTNRESGHCNGEGWRADIEPGAYAPYLQSAGYETMFAGKYLNRYGFENAGGITHIPPGWSHWRALVGNSVYYNYTLSIDGKPEVHGDNYELDYFTNVVERKAVEFLELERDKTKPFFMCLSTSAPHDPQTPAPQYVGEFPNVTAPRTEAFDHDPGSSKHWFTRMEPRKMTTETIANVDEKFRKKWRSLLSVDDMVKTVIDILEKQEVYNNTYIIFTSDHGYHLGQFSMPFDMRNPYEFDIRIPLVVKGPGIPANTIVHSPVVTVDLAPTFLDMAGIYLDAHRDAFDGVSMLSLARQELDPLFGQVTDRQFLVEYTGEGRHINAKIDKGCSQWKTGDFYMCYEAFGCRCVDTKNNTYSCIRTLTSSSNSIYCYFEDDESFEEYYDIERDPFQMENVIDKVDKSIKDELKVEMARMLTCSGLTCHPDQKSNHIIFRILFWLSDSLQESSLALCFFNVIFLAMLYMIYQVSKLKNNIYQGVQQNDE